MPASAVGFARSAPVGGSSPCPWWFVWVVPPQAFSLRTHHPSHHHPHRRGSLLATATRKDIPTRHGEGNTHTMPAGRTLGFFDKMLGLSISGHPKSAPPPDAPTPRRQGGEYGHMPAPAPVDLAVHGWAGMPQTDNKPASSGGGGGSSAGAPPSSSGRGTSLHKHSSQGRRSGGSSSGLGSSFAAMMPWNRGGGGMPPHSSHHSAASGVSHPRANGKSYGSYGSMSYASDASEPSHMSSTMGQPPPRFVHSLYTLVESNKLEVKDLAVPVTARDLNSVMDATATYVGECMRFYYGVVELPLTSLVAPGGAPPTPEWSKPPPFPRGSILVSENWQTARQIMVLVPNHLSGAPLGLWSRSLCIEQGLRFGTMLPYVDTAYREGFAVVICNPATIPPPNPPAPEPAQDSSASSSTGSIGRERKPSTVVDGNTPTPEEHVAWVYDHLLTQAQAQHVVLVGYSHGAKLCKEMVRRSLAHQEADPGQALAVSTIALVESCRLKDVDDEPDMLEFLANNAVNLKKSQHPIGRPLPDVAAAIGVGACFSLGTTEPGTNRAWSIYQGMGEVFKYCHERPRLPEKRSPRLKIGMRLMGLMGVRPAAAAAGAGGSSSVSKKTAAPMAGTAGGASGSPSQMPSPFVSSLSSVASNGSGLGGPTVSTHPGSTVFSESVYGGAGATVASGSMSVDSSAVEEYPMMAMIKRKDSWAALLDRKACMSVDNFMLERVIGKGAFGKVLMVRVRNDVARRVYAMKVINKSEIIRRGYVNSTKLERRILCEAAHPFVVRLRFAFQNAAKLYLVTDFYNGGNLLVHLKRNYVFAEHVAHFFAAEVFLAIQYLHSRHIVYRDLKPENVLMESSGHVALTDFGLSKQLLNGERTSTFCGTAEYLAPEQLRRTPYGTSVDWWAFGIFVYEMLVGRSPFYNRSRTSMYERIVNEDPVFPAEMSPDAVDLISLLLKKNPEQRLGATTVEAIKHHAFFRGMDWEALYSKDVTPPINPDIARASDCRYISSRYLSLDPRDPVEGDADQRFTDFTFIDEDAYKQSLAHVLPNHAGHQPSSGDGRESSTSDSTPWTTSSANTTSSAVTVASSRGGGGSSYFDELGSVASGILSQEGHRSVVVSTPKVAETAAGYTSSSASTGGGMASPPPLACGSSGGSGGHLDIATVPVSAAALAAASGGGSGGAPRPPKGRTVTAPRSVATSTDGAVAPAPVPATAHIPTPTTGPREE